MIARVFALLDGPRASLRRAGAAVVSQPQRRLTELEAAELVADYMVGATMQQLAVSWKLHRTTVTEHLRRADVHMRRQGIPADEASVVAALYAQGLSCARIGARYDCDGETVRQVLLKAGVRLRAPYERRVEGF